MTGSIVSEATKTGKKRYTYVAAGGRTIARQFLSDSDVESVDFGITDPSGYSSRGSAGIMSPYKQEELDGLGNNVGILPYFTIAPCRSRETKIKPLPFK